MRKLRPDELSRVSPSEATRAPRHPVRAIVENVRSAFNVGSILRTADALAMEHVHLAGFTAPGDHPRVHKAALGAQDTVPWSHHADFGDAADAALAAGCTLIAVELTDESTPIADLTAGDYPLCLVVGNEVDGVSPEALAACAKAIEIPQYGSKHSLNVAVAFGVAGYDVIRHYRSLVPASSRRQPPRHAPR